MPPRSRTAPRPPSALGALLLLLLLGACGGGKQTPPTASAAAAPGALPPVPRDPLALLPLGVRDLVSADLKQLRSSPHFAVAEPWIRRYGCIEADASHWLLERTERAVLAGYAAQPGAGSTRALAVLIGNYRPEDAARALAQAGSLTGSPAANVSEQTRGRFRLLTAGEASAAALGARALVIGDTERVLAALDVADGKQPSWRAEQTLMRGLDTEQWLSRHTVAAVAHVSDRTARRIGRELSAIGGRRLGEGLTESSAALAVVLAADFNLQAQVLYADGRAASDAAQGLRSILGRAGLVMRLAGLPAALDRTQVSADGDRLLVSLTLSADELRLLVDRLEPLFGDETPACGALSAIGCGATCASRS